MWGFFLANTAGLWFCFAIPLLKKIFSAAVSNVSMPSMNSALMTTLYWTDVVCSVYFRGHRDIVVNFSGAVVAVGNGCAVLLAALPLLMPPEWLPDWISGPYIILLTSAMTAITAVVALIGPISGALSGVSKVITKAFQYAGCLAMARPAIALVNALRVSLVARFQRIFLTRSKKAMKESLEKANAEKMEAANKEMDGQEMKQIEAARRGADELDLMQEPAEPEEKPPGLLITCDTEADMILFSHFSRLSMSDRLRGQTFSQLWMVPPRPDAGLRTGCIVQPDPVMTGPVGPIAYTSTSFRSSRPALDIEQPSSGMGRNRSARSQMLQNDPDPGSSLPNPGDSGVGLDTGKHLAHPSPLAPRLTPQQGHTDRYPDYPSPRRQEVLPSLRTPLLSSTRGATLSSPRTLGRRLFDVDLSSFARNSSPGLLESTRRQAGGGGAAGAVAGGGGAAASFNKRDDRSVEWAPST